MHFFSSKYILTLNFVVYYRTIRNKSSNKFVTHNITYIYLTNLLLSYNETLDVCKRHNISII